MSDQNLAFFKFVSPLIDTGIWAQMSSAARTLYPVLLRFSDGNFKPVYPGGKVLLKLTGFKQKSTLRKARNELVDLGLISISTGTGRKNTYYHFRFDTLSSVPAPPSGAGLGHAERSGSAIQPSLLPSSRGLSEDPPYNKIQISINNNVQRPAEEKSMDTEKLSRTALKKQFGEHEFNLALSECRMTGIPETHESLEKILYRSRALRGTTWSQIEEHLSQKISSGSLQMIKNSFLGEKNGAFFISDSLPEYLKELLKREYTGILFEPDGIKTERQKFWHEAGNNL
ncbi:MAG: helix-turn-helix domain-containing protein [Spirochaetia bacterium]|nr:helix-turn-helix domain-containing protein [Spirochaetia bacterium]